MQVFDCFMYFNEDVVLDLRLNMLDKYVDYFVIVESSFTHKGDKRELQFDNKKFEKFIPYKFKLPFESPIILSVALVNAI